MAKRKTNSEREEFWRLALELQRESGLTVREFCKREQLPEPGFYSWRKKLGACDGVGGNGRPASVSGRAPGRQVNAVKQTVSKASLSKSRSERGTDDSSRAMFVPVQVSHPTTPERKGTIEIIVGSGCVVRVADRFDRQTLRDVLGVLGAETC